MFGIGERDYFRYDHPRGRFITYFDKIQDQVYKGNDTGEISLDYFEEFRKQINNLNIPSEWKSKYCFDNINGRLERIFEKKTGYRGIENVPVHEIIEYADVLLSNYYEQEENKTYEEYKELFKNIKSEVKKNLSIKCLGRRLGIGDYFVQRVDDRVELIYNLGDGYVAKLPLQKQKIEDVIESTKAQEILSKPVTLEIKDDGFGEFKHKQVFNGIINNEKELGYVVEHEATVAVVNYRLYNKDRKVTQEESDGFRSGFKAGFQKGFDNGRISVLPDMQYAPISDSIYTIPKMMYLDVDSVLKRAREAFNEKDNKILNEEDFVNLVKKILVDEDKTELVCALAHSKV